MNALTTAVHDMDMDHRDADIFASQELLNWPNIISILQQMGGEY
jgi:hypothetical protein